MLGPRKLLSQPRMRPCSMLGGQSRLINPRFPQLPVPTDCAPDSLPPLLQLAIESNIRAQLKSDVAAKEAAAASLQAELAALGAKSEADASLARSEAVFAQRRCSELQLEQEQLAGAKAALEEQLAAREVAAAEMGATVAAMQADIARLEAMNAELKAAMDVKVGCGELLGPHRLLCAHDAVPLA